jgi:serine/threonine-protein kinase
MLARPNVLTLKLFGPPTLEGPEGPVTGRGVRGTRLGLLAVLATSRGRPVSRDKVAALLWPEADPQRARPQLSDALYLIRGALGEAAIRATGDDLSLNPDVVESDVAEFDRLLAVGQLEEAVALVAGPFLDGFHLGDSVEFDHWLSRERSIWGDHYAEALQALAERREAEHRFEDAARWWRRLADHDPGSGRVALRLMRALGASGDRAGALRHARSHAELLRQEFDVDPDPAVVAFAELLRHDPPTSAGAAAAPIPPAAAVEISVQAPATHGSPLVSPARRPRLAILLLVVASVWLGVRVIWPAGAVPPPTHSVAVLPFLNLSPDTAHA